MKIFIAALLLMGLSGCVSDPKIRAKKCIRINDDYFECEIIPERPERGERFR